MYDETQLPNSVGPDPDDNSFRSRVVTPPEPEKVDSAGLPAHQVGKLPHPHIGWALLWVLAFWLVQFLVSILVGIPVAAIALIVAYLQGVRSEEGMMAALEQTGLWLIPIGTFLSVVFALGVAFLFYRRDLRIRLAIRAPSPTHGVAVVLAVLPLAILASEATNCAAEFLPQFSSEMLGDFASQPWPLVVIAACLFPAIGEEVFCRGFLGRGLVAHHGPLLGVLLASLIFGVLHIDPVQATGAFVLGLALHFAYLTTHSLVAPITMHFLNNAFAFWTYKSASLHVPGLTPAPDGQLEHTPLLLLTAAAASALSLCLLLYQSRCRWLLDEGTAWTPGYVSAEEPPLTVDARACGSRVSPWLVAACGLTYVMLIMALWSSSR